MLGILCGLASEADAARTISHAKIALSCADPQRGRQLVRDLVQQGATRLLSFGLAGGLSPELPAGTMVIGTAVQSDQGMWQADAEWCTTLAQRLPYAVSGQVWGSETIVTTPLAKAELYRHKHCILADMESQIVAEAAVDAGLPFAILRAVIDTADMALPPAAHAPLDSLGRPRLGSILLSLVRRPSQLPELLRLGRNNHLALAALQQATTALA